MREIKFRGWNPNNKCWLYGFYLQNRRAHFVCPDEFAHGKSWDDYEILPETLGQFTGLTDKNGREIYEGDIVSTTAHGCRYVERVVWHENSLGGGYSFSFVGHGCGPACHKKDIMEVVGNIHDNQELLER